MDITELSDSATTTLPSLVHTLITGTIANSTSECLQLQYVSHPRGAASASIPSSADGAFSVLVRGLQAGETIVLINAQNNDAYFTEIPALSTQMWNVGYITLGVNHQICSGAIVDDNNTPITGAHVGVSGSSDAKATVFVRHNGNRFYVYGQLDGNTVNGVVLAHGFARVEFECAVGSRDITVLVKRPCQACVCVSLPDSAERDLLWASLNDAKGRVQNAERRTLLGDGTVSFQWSGIAPGYHDITVTSVRSVGALEHFVGYEMQPGPNKVWVHLARHNCIQGTLVVKTPHDSASEGGHLYITLERVPGANIFPECAAVRSGDRYLVSVEAARCVMFGPNVRGQCVRLGHSSTELVMDAPTECHILRNGQQDLASDCAIVIRPLDNAYLRNRSMPVVGIRGNELVVRNALLDDLLGPERHGSRIFTYMPCDYLLEATGGTVEPNTVAYANPPKSVTVSHH